MKSWLLSGPLIHWEFGKYRKWGVKNNFAKKSCWDKLRKGDIVYFYASRPTQGLVGVGIVTGWNHQSIPLWPEEIQQNKNTYPYRIYFEPIIKVTNASNKSVLKIDHMPLVTNAAINSISPKVAEELAAMVKKQWNVFLPSTYLGAKIRIIFYFLYSNATIPLRLIASALNLNVDLRGKTSE